LISQVAAWNSLA